MKTTKLIYHFSVAKKCSFNLGINISISFTPAIRNARFDETFTGSLTVSCVGNVQFV